jgi:hypothetical protein
MVVRKFFAVSALRRMVAVLERVVSRLREVLEPMVGESLALVARIDRCLGLPAISVVNAVKSPFALPAASQFCVAIVLLEKMRIEGLNLAI